MQEGIPDTQVGESTEGQRSGEEISVDKDCPLEIEFPFDGELFGKPGKLRVLRVHLTRAEKRRHNQEWTRQLRSSQATEEKQRQKDQEQQAMTEAGLKEPESNRMDMSHTTVTLATMTAERKQHALELETMRQKYEAWMKRAEDLTNENELLKKELERREVEETLWRKKEKEMEEEEMENSDTSIVGDAKPMNTTKREPEIKEGLLKKQEETQKELSPANSDSDATGTTPEEQTGKNMGRRRKASYLDDEAADSIPKKEVHIMMNKKKRLMEEGEVHIVILNQARRPPIKGKDHFMKMSQGRRLLRGY